MPVQLLRLTSRPLARSFSSTSTRATLNKIQLIGRVGADPTVTELGDRSVVNYTVATSETHSDKEGNLVKKTQWHRIVSWNSASWLPERIKKGDLVYVEGQLRYSDYTDKEGVQRTKADIYQSNCRLLAHSQAYHNQENE
ncbi:nucleic acid-binding protein [Hesseltinella vesiculosa]|uniref:Nucleic acid-binding protein n=1 Tax=Hesseltinella vesiculosa TaxID=101127 RepID=A0A1X2GRM4_9FUNG|nr:nucleic acid-binding protein [Hesseltinella vesiculosa]